MAEFNFISKEELKEIFGEMDLYEEVNEKIYPSLEKIKNYCNQFIQSYNKYLTKTGLTSQGINKTEVISNLLSQGTFILYEIRGALIGEDIQFIIGNTSPKGTKITANIYDQREVLSHLHFDLKNMEILVNNELKNAQINTFLDQSILNQWGKVIQWATVPNWKEAKKLENEVKTNERYKKVTNDENIIFYYTGGKRHQLNTYYGEREQYFNRGWLFEWFLQYTDSLLNQLNNSSISIEDNRFWPAPTSLSKMIGENRMDRTKGYKGGDVRIQNQAYQAKMGNHRIIRVGDLYNAIIKLRDILSQYIKGDLNKNTTAEELTYLFTEYDKQTGIVETINKDYKEIMDNVLENLGKNFLIK